MRVRMMTNLTLQNDAACKDKGADMFFVDEGPLSDIHIRNAIKRAVGICNLCSVQDICLMTAVNNEEEFGIWGGYTSRERKKLFKKGERIDIEQAKDLVIWKRQ